MTLAPAAGTRGWAVSPPSRLVALPGRSGPAPLCRARDETPTTPEPELMAAATEEVASQIAQDEPESNLDASAEPAEREVAAEPALKLSTEPPELLETQREPLERVASHSS